MDHINTTCRQDASNGMFEGLAMSFGLAIFITNLIVVIAIRRGGRKLQKARFYCICNLAVADMLAGLLLLWNFGLQRLLLQSRPPFAELAQKSAWILTVWTSLMSQVVIALDRYTHVRMGTGGSPTFLGFNIWKNGQRRKLVLIGISLTWILPAIIYVTPVLTFWNCVDTCSCYTRANNTKVIYMECAPSDYCSEVNPAFTKGSMLMLGLVLLILPVVSSVFYARIYLFVKRTSKSHRSRQQPKPIKSFLSSACYIETLRRAVTEDGAFNYSKDDSGRSSPFLTPDQSDSAVDRNGSVVGNAWRSSNRNSRSFDVKRSNGADQSNQSSLNRAKKNSRANGKKVSKTNPGLRQKHQARDLRLLHTMIIILLLFVVTTVPLGIVSTLSFTETDKTYMKPTKYLLVFSLLNSLINPWVYFWRFSEMRTSISRMVCFGGKRRRDTRERMPPNKSLRCCLPQAEKPTIYNPNSKGHAPSLSSNTF